jgi:hypothetical protein
LINTRIFHGIVGETGLLVDWFKKAAKEEYLAQGPFVDSVQKPISICAPI